MSGTVDAGRLSEIRKCPTCGGELEKGYLLSSGIWWDTEKHDFQPGKERLTDYPAWTQTNFAALRCRNCRIIMFSEVK